MKKIELWLRMMACVLCMVSSLLFAAIVTWQLFSGDWKLFENEHLAFVQILGKLLLCLYCFWISLRGIMGKKDSFIWEGIQLLGISLAINPFLSNHLGVLFVLFATVFLILELSVYRFKENNIVNRKKFK